MNDASLSEDSGSRPSGSDVAHEVKGFLALAPLRRPSWLWSLYLRVVLAFTRRFATRFFAEVHRLAPVHTMHWLLVPPFATGTRAGKPEDRGPHLLFESNFSGDAGEYIESFARALRNGMGMIFRAALGYPGIHDAQAFTRFALGFNRPPAVYHCAYPGTTPVMVAQALEMSRRADPSVPRVSPSFHSPLPLRTSPWGSMASPRWATVVMRIRDDRVAALEAHLDRVADESDTDHPFRNLVRVHFARFTLIPVPSGCFLMLSVNFDADRRYRRATRPPVVGRAPDSLSDIALHEVVLENYSALAKVLSHCEGFTELAIGDDLKFLAMVDYLIAHQCDRGSGRMLLYACAPQTTAAAIRRALAWERSRRAVEAGHGMRP